MKAIKLNNKMLSYLAAFLMVFTFAACDDDDKSSGNYETSSIESLLTEANGLIANSVEGISAGDFKPGAKAELQTVVDWVVWTMERAENQEDISDAAVKLQRYIDIFKANTVAVAMPWIQQENDTWIQISDNIKTVLDGAFTIELECYVVDLNVKGHSNNLFAAEQDGPDSGFAVRYYSDGKLQVVVGDGGWTDTGDQGVGVMKSGEWMHVTLTNTGTHQKLYVNGSVVASQDKDHLLAADVPFIIGNSPKWTDRVCNTLVRELRVWNSVLDESTINANRTASFDGTESGLECYFPFGSDLGDSFSDVTGKCTATIKGKVEWVNAPPVIVLDNSKLIAAIKNITDFKATVVEGNVDGDYPVGTIAYIDELIVDANDALVNEGRQTGLDDKADALVAATKLINSMLVGDTDGIFIDRDNSDAVGLRITPNYTPQGDYTIEFNVKVKSLFGYGTGEFFNNGENGVWVYGYKELTEENVLASGGIRNFSHDDSDRDWDQLKTDPLVMKVGTWQHVAVVHDNTARTTKIFVDGELKATSEDRGSLRNSGWGEMWLGNGWGKMDGYMKDFRLWDVVRATADLDADIDGTEEGLNVYFPLDRVNGVKFADKTGTYQGDMRGISWNVVED